MCNKENYFSLTYPNTLRHTQEGLVLNQYSFGNVNKRLILQQRIQIALANQ